HHPRKRADSRHLDCSESDNQTPVERTGGRHYVINARVVGLAKVVVIAAQTLCLDCSEVAFRAIVSGVVVERGAVHPSPLSSGAIRNASDRAERSKERAMEILVRVSHDGVGPADEFFD